MNQLSEPHVGREPVRLSDEAEFTLGSVTVRPSLREMCWGEHKEQLEPRVMQVLVALAGASGNVVSRDELIRLCWDGRIVGEAAINRCILKLRDLAEAVGENSFRIETIPRVGYRLLPGGVGAASVPDLPETGSPPTQGGKNYARIALVAGFSFLIIIAAAAVIYEFGFKTRIPPGSAPTLYVERSIAVLPFKNLSSDRDAGYLAAGVQDEILTRLAKVGSLKVISRTSADQYENKLAGIREIARRLGVANILEGSVQKAGDKVRINVQLIRAASDDHLWAEDYDRQLDDIFSVESDVANAIATALAAKITPGERNEISLPPTANPKAYQYYLHALAFVHTTDDSSLHVAIQLFQQAVDADPKFALAWAWLARMQAYVHFGENLETVREGAAHAALAKALQLQPDSADTQAAKGFYLYYGEMNYPAAERELAQVHARWPGNAEALEALALIERRLGKWRASSDDFAKLILLDPLVRIHRIVLAGNLSILHNFPGALRVLDDALKIWPNDSALLAGKADAYHYMGRLDLAEAVLKNVHPTPDDGNLFWAFMDQFWLGHQYVRGIGFFRGLIGLGEERENPDSVTFILRVALGELLRMNGDEKAAKESYSRAIIYMENQLKKQPNDADLLTPLSVAYAGMGDSARALRLSEQSIALFRKTDDQLDVQGAEDNHMHLIARFGDRSEAIREFQAALNAPGQTTPEVMRLDPDLGRLRGDPRFEKLLKSSKAN
jgi:TolB-like protein/DNA-binding winged helix-turn-helix (wHTH) protein/cytochrome c-type biogenesis protein CcmH/NrfG